MDLFESLITGSNRSASSHSSLHFADIHPHSPNNYILVLVFANGGVSLEQRRLQQVFLVSQSLVVGGDDATALQQEVDEAGVFVSVVAPWGRTRVVWRRTKQRASEARPGIPPIRKCGVVLVCMAWEDTRKK